MWDFSLRKRWYSQITAEEVDSSVKCNLTLNKKARANYRQNPEYKVVLLTLNCKTEKTDLQTQVTK